MIRKSQKIQPEPKKHATFHKTLKKTMVKSDGMGIVNPSIPRDS